MASKVYPQGLFTFKKHEKAPGFVLGDMNINIDTLVKWCNEHPEYLRDYKGERQLPLQMTNNDEGRVVISVNTYRKEGDAPAAKKQDNNDDLPF